MKALHCRPAARRPPLRRLGLALAAPALLLMLACAVVIAAALRGALHSKDTMLTRTEQLHSSGFTHRFAGSGTARALLPDDTGAPVRRWPDEIEHLLSSMPQVEDGQGLPPTVETDQRCSRLEDGLAHCVMIECQTAGDQTSCVEMVVTARRLREPPHGLRAGEERNGALDDGDLDATHEAPRLLDTRHEHGARMGAITAMSRF